MNTEAPFEFAEDSGQLPEFNPDAFFRAETDEKNCRKQRHLSTLKEKMNKITDWSKGFSSGYICCLVVHINLNGGVTTDTKEMWKGAKMTIEELEAHDVYEGDIAVLKKHWDELNY